MPSNRLIVEISQRPIYVGGTGPPLAPISLTPDDPETGWFIVEKAKVSGIPRYIIAPKENPSSRRVVKMESILDWISAKAYEDYEFDQYKKQTEIEMKQENENLDRLVRKRAQKAAAEQAKKHADRIAETYRRSTRERSGFQTSTSYESEDLAGNDTLLKRKPNEEQNVPMKRRTTVTLGRQRQIYEYIPPGSGFSRTDKHSDNNEYGYDNTLVNKQKLEEEEEENIPNTRGTRKAPHQKSWAPILPPRRNVSSASSRDSSEPKTFENSVGIATRVPSRVVPLAPAPHQHLPPLLAAQGALQPMPATKSPTKDPPILPPRNILERFSTHANKRASANREGTVKNLKPQKSFPSSSRKSTRKVKSSQKKLAASALNPDDLVFVEPNAEWEVNGILSSELRPHHITGQPRRYFLVSWAGNWDPTWEPEENVSKDTIQSFEAEERRAALEGKASRLRKENETLKSKESIPSSDETVDDETIDDETVDDKTVDERGFNGVFDRWANGEIGREAKVRNVNERSHNNEIDSIDDEETEDEEDLQLQSELHKITNAIDDEPAEEVFDFEAQDSMFISVSSPSHSSSHSQNELRSRSIPVPDSESDDPNGSNELNWRWGAAAAHQQQREEREEKIKCELASK